MTDGDRPPDDRTMETVGVYPSITEASIVRGRLDQAGIRSWMQEELPAGQLFQVGTALGGVTLQLAATSEPVATRATAESARSQAVEARE